MVKFEKLGMILKPVDRLHAKFNTGALLLGAQALEAQEA